MPTDGTTHGSMTTLPGTILTTDGAHTGASDGAGETLGTQAIMAGAAGMTHGTMDIMAGAVLGMDGAVTGVLAMHGAEVGLIRREDGSSEQAHMEEDVSSAVAHAPAAIRSII